MGFIDGTIVAIALPQIRTALEAGFVEAQWISNAYMLTLSAFILLGGGLADRLGVKYVFGKGIVLFILASVACAFAWDATSLIVFRTIQGVGSAVMLPGSMALIAKNTPRQQRGKAMGIWIASSAITTAMGPFFGGFLLSYGGDDAWRWIFAFNLPIGAYALLVLWKKVPWDLPANSGGVASLDWVGAALLTVSMGALAAGLTFIGEGGGSVFAWSLIGLGCGIGICALMWELRVTEAMIDVRLFKSKEFSGINLVTFLCLGLHGGSNFFSANVGYRFVEASRDLCGVNVFAVLYIDQFAFSFCWKIG